MNYPLTTFHFQVEWGGTRLGFTEVAGLESRVEIIEYREGKSADYGSLKMPGRPRFGNVTLKRGLISGDNEFYQWLATTRFNQVERRDMTIQTLNEQHDPVFVWKLRNAWPVSLIAPHFDASASDVAIEMLEVAYEGVTTASV